LYRKIIPGAKSTFALMEFRSQGYRVSVPQDWGCPIFFKNCPAEPPSPSSGKQALEALNAHFPSAAPDLPLPKQHPDAFSELQERLTVAVWLPDW